MAIPLAALAALGQAAGAIKGVVDQITRLPDAVRGFVDAFSPATGERLDAAFRSLHATIGYALEPILSAASATVEHFADAISSGMDQLRGPIQEVSGLFVGSLRPAMAAAADVVDGLAEAAKELLPLMEPLGAMLEAALGIGRIIVAAGVAGLVEAIGKLVPGAASLAEITDAVTQGFVRLAEATIRLADFMLHAIGLDDALEKMLKRLAADPVQGGRRAGAPQGFAMGGLDEIYRKRLLAAAQGGGPSIQEQSRDYLKDLRELAKDILEEMKNRPEEREARRKEAGKLVLYEGEGVGAVVARKTAEILGNLFRQKDRNEP